MYPLVHIVYLRDLADKYKLDYRNEFSECRIADLQKCYNGIGPQRWEKFGEYELPVKLAEALGKTVREVLTYVLGDYEVCALIHDWDCVKLDKNDEGFKEASDRFKANVYKVAKIKCDEYIAQKKLRFYHLSYWVKKGEPKIISSIMYKAVSSETGKEAYMKG